jgi:hypothetical protein
MDSRDNLLLALDEARERLLTAIQMAETDQSIYPSWTIKEILDHITGWDDAVIASLKAHIADAVPATPASRGINHYNASTVTERENLSYQHTLDEFVATREILKQVIHELPPEKLDEPIVYPRGPTGSFDELIQIFVHHENEHAEEIAQILQEEKKYIREQ